MKIHFIHSSSGKSMQAYRYMTKMYGQAELKDADCVVVLSGDGMVLRAFHETYGMDIPVYGMNRGGFGFLTNNYHKENLIDRIKNAQSFAIHPLNMRVEMLSGEVAETIAINEVYLLRETHQSAKVRVSVNGDVKIKELVCDGLIACTDVGSTAYNYSANGPIIPLNSGLIALTPISPFRPRCWRGALLRSSDVLNFEIMDNVRRPVCAVADYVEYRSAKSVIVSKSNGRNLTLLLDKDNSLEKKFMQEQFAT